MNQTKVLFTLMLGGLLATATTAEASSPDALEKHYQQVNTSCLNASNLQNAQPVGSIFRFGDEVGYDALLIRGNYSQPDMNNQVGQFLCLFNRRTRQAYVREVKQLQQSPNKTLSGLPGQTIEQVRQWASKHSFLLPLQSVEKLEQGYPNYKSVINLGQKAGLSASYIAFEVFTDSNGIVTSQTIDYRDYSSIRRPLAFTPSHSQGLQLIQTIYGEQIKNDFIQSKFLKHKDVTGSNGLKVNVYVGKLFVYETWNSKDSSAQFSISRLEDFKGAKQIPAQNFNDGLDILLKASRW
ncbi:hypothetical protein WKK05_13210 [Nostoc sp. UHCC 0302]|uniref:hypothetical protein n=1 Tax=Nostoc sp. UHCC 0302 TaxID=3134896 RepID=UPI00311CB33A